MDLGMANKLWMAITPLEAQEALLALNIALSPQSKPADRKKFHKALYKEAYGNLKTKVTLADLEESLKNGR